jgi:transposase-like protein
MTIRQICGQLSISEQSYYRWRKQHSGMKISQVKRMKDMERVIFKPFWFTSGKENMSQVLT